MSSVSRSQDTGSPARLQTATIRCHCDTVATTNCQPGARAGPEPTGSLLTPGLRKIQFQRQSYFGSHCVTTSEFRQQTRLRSNYWAPLGPAGHSGNQYRRSSLLSIDFLLFFGGFYNLTHREKYI